jgi:putative oxidoreductase
VVVAYSELLGGSALVLGLFTRLATIPLIVSMSVAILTAKLSDLHGIFDLVGFDEFTYLVVLVMIAIIGPGAVSIDHLLCKRLGWKAR